MARPVAIDPARPVASLLAGRVADGRSPLPHGAITWGELARRSGRHVNSIHAAVEAGGEVHLATVEAIARALGIERITIDIRPK